MFNLFKGHRENQESSLRLVVGLNRVDQILPAAWDIRLNQPFEPAAVEIQRRCENVIERLSREAGIGSTHIEYYSALKRYRLHNLLNRVIEHCLGGFKLADVRPKHFEDVEGVDPDVRQFTKEERARRAQKSKGKGEHLGPDGLMAELGRYLSRDDFKQIETRFADEMRQPPRVAVLGQSGVGKTTTVNALFATDWETNPVEVGTHEAQSASVRLPSGGAIQVIDLPGYGRSIEADESYEQIYRRVIPDCDLVLLVIQADRGDLADDIEMISKLNTWLVEPAVAQSPKAR